MALVLEVSAVSGLLAVFLGAFGAHALKGRLDDERLRIYHTAVQYQMFHTVATIAAVMLWRLKLGDALAMTAAWLFLVGMVVFSGSLYALAVSGRKALGAVTPVGGLLFLAGWFVLFLGLAR